MKYVPGPFPQTEDLPNFALAVWDELSKLADEPVAVGVPASGGGGFVVIGGLTSAAAPAGTPSIGGLTSVDV